MLGVDQNLSDAIFVEIRRPMNYRAPGFSPIKQKTWIEPFKRDISPAVFGGFMFDKRIE
jgi:hypothetical protein